jgi:ribose 1,5-bisphosphokinase
MWVRLRAQLRQYPRRIGPGHLILIVGPSGAGKDTVLSLLRRDLSRDDKSVVIPRRVITRMPDGSEDHDTLSHSEFQQAVATGAFSMWWTAHGNSYGIPISADDDIRSRRTVICNVSRTAVSPARERYANVTVVLITAPAELLRQRLAARQRESDGDLEQRIARSGALAEALDPNIVIANVGAPELAAGKLIDIVAAHGRPFAF